MRQGPLQGESHVDFLRESEGCLPPPHDSFLDAGEAITVPDKIVTLHDFFRINYGQLHDVAFFIIHFFWLLEVEGGGREKRKKERATETDTETQNHTTKISSLITLSMSLCLLSMSMFATLFVDVLLSHSVECIIFWCLYAVICHERVSYIFVVAAVVVAVAVGVALLLVLVHGHCSYTCFCC